MSTPGFIYSDDVKSLIPGCVASFSMHTGNLHFMPLPAPDARPGSMPLGPPVAPACAGLRYAEAAINYYLSIGPVDNMPKMLQDQHRLYDMIRAMHAPAGPGPWSNNPAEPSSVDTKNEHQDYRKTGEPPVPKYTGGVPPPVPIQADRGIPYVCLDRDTWNKLLRPTKSCPDLRVRAGWDEPEDEDDFEDEYPEEPVREIVPLPERPIDRIIRILRIMEPFYDAQLASVVPNMGLIGVKTEHMFEGLEMMIQTCLPLNKIFVPSFGPDSLDKVIPVQSMENNDQQSQSRVQSQFAPGPVPIVSPTSPSSTLQSPVDMVRNGSSTSWADAMNSPVSTASMPLSGYNSAASSPIQQRHPGPGPFPPQVPPQHKRMMGPPPDQELINQMAKAFVCHADPEQIVYYTRMLYSRPLPEDVNDLYVTSQILYQLRCAAETVKFALCSVTNPGHLSQLRCRMVRCGNLLDLMMEFGHWTHPMWLVEFQKLTGVHPNMVYQSLGNPNRPLRALDPADFAYLTILKTVTMEWMVITLILLDGLEKLVADRLRAMEAQGAKIDVWKGIPPEHQVQPPLQNGFWFAPAPAQTAGPVATTPVGETNSPVSPSSSSSPTKEKNTGASSPGSRLSVQTLDPVMESEEDDDDVQSQRSDTLKDRCFSNTSNATTATAATSPPLSDDEDDEDDCE